jgi:aspartate/methionine/tyrosine aminotransferase
MHTTIINTLTEKYLWDWWNRKTLLVELFSNQELKENIPNEIRRATIIGQIANEVLRSAWNTDLCKILAIGDIEYFGELDTEWKNIVKRSLDKIDIKDLIGYDLGWQGSGDIHKAIYSYMSHYYNTLLLPDSVIDSIIPSYGGTDSFVSIINTLKLIGYNKRVNFIYPEASFPAHIKIAELFLWNENLVKIPKPDKKNFFILNEQIQEYYRDNKDDEILNIFYITPVGNPTGNKLDHEDLYEVLSEIHMQDTNAVIILDTVYIWLLRTEESHTLLQQIFQDKNLMNKIIFTESISKTLWTTGIRIGWTWTLNDDISAEIKKYTTLTKAWFSKLLDNFCINLLNDPEIFTFQDQIYSYWSEERMKFRGHMQQNYPELFDFDESPLIEDREWIYILLRVRENISIEEVFSQTGTIWVKITLSDWDYIRYAFGNVKNI